VTLAALTLLVWPTIQRTLESGPHTPSWFVATIVALAFTVIGLLVYFLAGKTLWNLLELLIVPLPLTVIGLWFTMQQDARQQQIEEQRAQDAAPQAYLDQMSQLLLEKDLRNSAKDSEARTLARARTLTVLGRLDPGRKTEIMQFLVEAELVQRVEETAPIIDLSDADLSIFHLIYADLNGAFLSDAELNFANLSGAILNDADLRDVRGVTEEQLEEQAKTLEGATMPDGSIHP
jgi:hypothetical protein